MAYLPLYAYAIILIGTVVWFYPFVPAHQKTPPANVVNRRSRWGTLSQIVAYSVLWQGHFWTRPLPGWHTAVSLLLFTLASCLSWTSSRALAGQMRLDAALGADHHLVRSGPYALVRNPIYTSMLLVFAATAVLIATWQLFLISMAFFFLGTEIRVRTEEELLASRFGEEFRNYKSKVPAYIPFL
jgi:protein-S-isoprenylcysteine O-methyltransferase Ste14